MRFSPAGSCSRKITLHDGLLEAIGQSVCSIAWISIQQYVLLRLVPEPWDLWEIKIEI